MVTLYLSTSLPPLITCLDFQIYHRTASILGQASDILWATGVSDGDGAFYHEATRGVRYVAWLDPTSSFVDAMKC